MLYNIDTMKKSKICFKLCRYRLNTDYNTIFIKKFRKYLDFIKYIKSIEYQRTLHDTYVMLETSINDCNFDINHKDLNGNSLYDILKKYGHFIKKYYPERYKKLKN